MEVGTGVGVAIGILIWVVVGIVVGLLARAILPGKQNIGILGTMLAGIGGALIAGFIGRYIADPLWVHLVLAVIGAMVLVGLFSRLGSSGSS